MLDEWKGMLEVEKSGGILCFLHHFSMDSQIQSFVRQKSFLPFRWLGESHTAVRHQNNTLFNIVCLRGCTNNKTVFRAMTKSTAAFSLLALSLWGKRARCLNNMAGYVKATGLGDLGKEIMSAPLVFHSFGPLT